MNQCENIQLINTIRFDDYLHGLPTESCILYLST